MQKKKLSIIIPMYNEKNIKKNLQKALQIFDTFNRPYEIVLVDDGSTTNCYSEAKEVKSDKIRVVGYKPNKGKGNAIKYGAKFVTGDYVAFLDADLELDPNQLKGFIKILEETKSDIIIGSKRHPDSKVHYPLFRRFMSIVYQIMIKILFNLNVRETQVGLKLFKRECIDSIFPKILVKRFAFDLEVLVNANKLKYKITEAPINLDYKFGSTVSPSAVYYMLLDTAAIFYRLKILHYYG